MLRGFLAFLAALGVAGAEAPPFWKAKEKVYSRVREGEVIVSVRSGDPVQPFKKRLTINGGGHVQAPRDFVFAYAQDFDQIARLSGFIQKAKYDAEAGTVDADIAAFGYKSSFRLKVSSDSSAEPKRIGLEMVKGPLTGLRSSVTFASLSGDKTEVGIEGDYRYDEFPIPKMFLEFGMEVVFQKMAVRLRSTAEAAHRARSGSP